MEDPSSGSDSEMGDSVPSNGSTPTSPGVLAVPPPTPVACGHKRQPRPISTGKSADIPPPLLSAVRTELAARMDGVTMASPVAERPADRSAAAASQSFRDQNRQILPGGLSESQEAQSLEPPAQATDGPTAAGTTTAARKLAGSQTRPKLGSPLLAPLITVNGNKQYRMYPYSPVPSSPASISPCVYVKAATLRLRSSRASTEAPDRQAKNNTQDTKKAKGARSTQASRDMASPEPSPELSDGKLLVSVLVRPASSEKEPFVIQREFDLKELHKAVPKPDARMAAHMAAYANMLQSPAVTRSPLSALPSSNAPPLSTATGALPSAAAASIKHNAVLSPSATSPSSSLASGRIQHNRPRNRQHNRKASHNDLPSPDRFMGQGGVPIPIRPHAALGYLPGLAAVLLSGYVKPGDSIEQPLPHPEAWPQTVSYVYKGHGDLTDAVRQNIEHLGGRLN